MAADAEQVWKRQLRQLVENNDLAGLQEAHRNGQNVALRDMDVEGHSVLTLAACRHLLPIVEFFLEEVPALHDMEVVAACIEVLCSWTRTNNPIHLETLSCLMTRRRQRRIRYVVVLQGAFKVLHNCPKEFLVQFCEVALRAVPELCRDISLNMVLYEQTEVYWRLLSRGMPLNDLWPVNSDDYPYSKYYVADSLFDIYFTYGCLFTIHTSSRNKITKMTIQAANGEASPAVLYVIQNFPTDLYDDVFKYLILAGFTMSPASIQRMANVEIDKAAELIRWYKDFHSRPHSLKHLCRLCVRKHLQYNVVYAVQQILLPEDLKRYLLITDPDSYWTAVACCLLLTHAGCIVLGSSLLLDGVEWYNGTGSALYWKWDWVQLSGQVWVGFCPWVYTGFLLLLELDMLC